MKYIGTKIEQLALEQKVNYEHLNEKFHLTVLYEQLTLFHVTVCLESHWNRL